MSPSEGGRGRLIVEGPPAGRIEIIDGAFTKIAEGTRRLECELPEGIYSVRWLGALGEEEQSVRLFADDEVSLRGGFGCVGEAPAEVAAEEIASTLALGGGIAAVPAQAGESAIEIVVEAGEGAIQSDPARSLRLLAADGREIATRCSKLEKASEGDSCRAYRVPAGAYRLRCHGAEHRWLEQTIQAFPGRRTIVFMRYGRAYEMRVRRDERVRTALRGIDPGATLAVSVAIDFEGETGRARFPLHETLLQGLAGGSALADRQLVDELARPEADPYARLYAAVLLLHRSLVEPGHDAYREALGFAPPAEVRHWADEIAGTMQGLDFADLQCLRWRLGGEPGPTLAGPPMLARCWQWAIEWSAAQPRAVPSTPELDAAADAATTYSPWLVWRVADTKPGVSAELFDHNKLSWLVAEIEEGIGRIREQLGEEGYDVLLAGGGHADLPIGLSGSSLRLVDDLRRMLRLVHEDKAAAVKPEEIIRHLCMPAESLLKRADQTLEEINQVQLILE